MVKALFISSEDELHLLSSLFLNQGEKKIRVLPARSISESNDFLDEEKFNIIYLGHKIKKDQELSELAKRLMIQIKENKSTVFGTNKALKGKEWANYFNPMASHFSIMQEVVKHIGSTIKSEQTISIPILSVLEFDTYPADVYLHSEGKLKKVKKAGEDILIEDIYGYQEMGHEVLHLHAQTIHEQIERMNESQEQFESDNPEKNFEQALEYTVELLKTSNLPLKEEYVQMSTQAQAEVKNIIHASKESRSVLKDLVSKKEKYYFKHMSMTSMICCFILDEMMLTDESMKQKLCLASQFQNIYLQNEKEHKVSNDDELVHFKPEDKKRIHQHALLAAELLKKNPNFDADVLKVIKEQHGDKRGIGFPDKIQSSLKLSLIFQISTLFSQTYLTHIDKGLTPNVAEIYDRIHKKLTMKDQSILKALKTVIGEL